MADLTDTVDRLARPLAVEAGVDLVDVAVKGSESRQRVQVVVDRKGGIDLETCRDLSKALARRLDAEDAIAGRYTLEVTSPGTDWPLSDQRSFDRVQGRAVKATLRVDADGTREISGVVTSAGSDSVVLTAKDGSRETVSYDSIVKATQELRW
ncbi:ribosome maturation factor RimP [soil metagenome]